MRAVITACGPIDGAFAEAAGTRYKALAPFSGTTLIDATIAALREIGMQEIAIVANDEIARHCEHRVDRVVADAGSGGKNAIAALEAWADDAPLLYLTCDMPFITASALRTFIDATPPDTLTMAICDHAAYSQRFPGAPPAGITMGPMRIVNGGAFCIPVGVRDRLRNLSARLFDARKSPWRMANIAGWTLLAKMLLGSLNVHDVEARASSLIDVRARAVWASPELCFDTDTIDDYRYARG